MPKTTPKPLNECLRDARRAADLKQQEVAELAGLSLSTVNKLERSPDSNPNLGTLDSYARACGTTLLALITAYSRGRT